MVYALLLCLLLPVSTQVVLQCGVLNIFVDLQNPLTLVSASTSGTPSDLASYVTYTSEIVEAIRTIVPASSSNGGSDQSHSVDGEIAGSPVATPISASPAYPYTNTTVSSSSASTTSQATNKPSQNSTGYFASIPEASSATIDFLRNSFLADAKVLLDLANLNIAYIEQSFPPTEAIIQSSFDAIFPSNSPPRTYLDYEGVIRSYPGYTRSALVEAGDQITNGAINLLYYSCVTKPECLPQYNSVNDAKAGIYNVVTNNFNSLLARFEGVDPSYTYFPPESNAFFFTYYNNFPTFTDEVYGVHDLLPYGIRDGFFNGSVINATIAVKDFAVSSTMEVEALINIIAVGPVITYPVYQQQKREYGNHLLKVLQANSMRHGHKRKIWSIMAMQENEMLHRRQESCASLTSIERALGYFEQVEKACGIIDAANTAYSLASGIAGALLKPIPAEIVAGLESIVGVEIDQVASICSSGTRIACPGGQAAWTAGSTAFTVIGTALEIAELAAEAETPAGVAIGLKVLGLACKAASAAKQTFLNAQKCCQTSCASSVCQMAGGYCVQYNAQC